MKERLQEQHLVPRSFKRELGLTKKELDEHVIYISSKIHDKEDRYVAAIKMEMIRARKQEGIITTVEDVLKMRDAGWFRA